MKKTISVVLALVMTVVSFSGLQCFAEGNPKGNTTSVSEKFDAKNASVEETLREIEKSIISDNSLEGKNKKNLLDVLDALKKNVKSEKHWKSLLWDKVKSSVKFFGTVTLGVAIGLLIGACISENTSNNEVISQIQSIAKSSATFLGFKRELEKKVVDSTFWYGLKEDGYGSIAYTGAFVLNYVPSAVLKWVTSLIF